MQYINISTYYKLKTNSVFFLLNLAFLFLFLIYILVNSVGYLKHCICKKIYIYIYNHLIKVSFCLPFTFFSYLIYCFPSFSPHLKSHWIVTVSNSLRYLIYLFITNKIFSHILDLFHSVVYDSFSLSQLFFIIIYLLFIFRLVLFIY